MPSDVEPWSDRTSEDGLAEEITWANTLEWLRRTVVFDRMKEGGPDEISAARLVGSLRPRLDDAVAIVGSPRSGTTFLGQCVRAVEGVSYHYEPVATKAATRNVYEGLWSDSRARWFFETTFGLLQRVQLEGGFRFVEKTPRHAFIVGFLAEAFPDAQFVHIVRDGRDVALSLAEKGWLGEDAPPDEIGPSGYRKGPYSRFWVEPGRRDEFVRTDDVHRCIWAWRRHVEAARDAGADLGPERYLEIRYEELVRRPEDVAGDVADFLALDPEQTSSLKRRASTAHEQSLERWRTKLPGDDRGTVAEEAGELLGELGYPPA